MAFLIATDIRACYEMLSLLLTERAHGAFKLISWKYTFKRLNEEYDIAKRKKQALDNLFASRQNFSVDTRLF